MDEGNASGKFAFFGKLTEKDSVVLTEFTSNASNESLGTRLRRESWGGHRLTRLNRIPCETQRPGRGVKRPANPLSPIEWKFIFGRVQFYIYLIVSYDTGARRSELLKLTPGIEWTLNVAL